MRGWRKLKSGVVQQIADLPHPLNRPGTNGSAHVNYPIREIDSNTESESRHSNLAIDDSGDATLLDQCLSFVLPQSLNQKQIQMTKAYLDFFWLVKSELKAMVGKLIYEVNYQS